MNLHRIESFLTRWKSERREWAPHAQGLLLGLIALYSVFYLYRPLLDDSWYLSILQGLTSSPGGNDPFSRPLHSFLMSLEGAVFGTSLRLAMWINVGIHLLTGWIAWNRVVPLMPERYRETSAWGVAAFLAHPIALQTMVHVAQRAEILGALFVTLSFWVYFKVRTRKSYKEPGPHANELWLLLLFTIGALFSKEPYGLIPVALTVSLLHCTRSWKRGGKTVALMLGFLAFGVLGNSFSNKTVQNLSNYERTKKYIKTIEEGKEVAPADSIVMPVRTRSENLVLQVKLVPTFVQAVFYPLGLVMDYGQFPLGRETYSRATPALAVGMITLLVLFGFLFFMARRMDLDDRVLLGLPFLIYAVYWIIPVYDPLFLYRLYGVVFLGMVFWIPVLLQRLPYRQAVMAVMVLFWVGCGAVRAWEIQNPIRQGTLEKARRPGAYRLTYLRLHAMEEGRMWPVNCEAEVGPTLKWVPTASLAEIEWAVCLSMQGDDVGARVHAMKALESEGVPEHVHQAIDILMRSANGSMNFSNLHPSNTHYFKKAGD